MSSPRRTHDIRCCRHHSFHIFLSLPSFFPFFFSARFFLVVLPFARPFVRFLVPHQRPPTRERRSLSGSGLPACLRSNPTQLNMLETRGATDRLTACLSSLSLSLRGRAPNVNPSIPSLITRQKAAAGNGTSANGEGPSSPSPAAGPSIGTRQGRMERRRGEGERARERMYTRVRQNAICRRHHRHHPPPPPHPHPHPPHTDGSIPMKAPTNFPDFFFLLFYATMATMNLLPPST